MVCPSERGFHLVHKTFWFMHSNVRGHRWKQSVRMKCLPHVFIYWKSPMEGWVIQRHPRSHSSKTSFPFPSHISIRGTLQTIWNANTLWGGLCYALMTNLTVWERQKKTGRPCFDCHWCKAFLFLQWQIWTFYNYITILRILPNPFSSINQP